MHHKSEHSWHGHGQQHWHMRGGWGGWRPHHMGGFSFIFPMLFLFGGLFLAFTVLRWFWLPLLIIGGAFLVYNLVIQRGEGGSRWQSELRPRWEAARRAWDEAGPTVTVQGEKAKRDDADDKPKRDTGDYV